MSHSIKKTSRRGALKAGLAMLGIGIAAQARAQDADKLAQTVVQYQPTPKDNARCSLCVNFVAPNACKIVVGPIVPQGWCVAFAPKNGCPSMCGRSAGERRAPLLLGSVFALLIDLGIKLRGKLV